MRLMERLDSTVPLAARPYGLLSSRARRMNRDVYDTRLLLQKTTCMTGADAARVFYDPGLFVRAGAAPRRLSLTLFGENGVQSLDGERHRARKAMFMSLMAPDARDELRDIASRFWRERIREWEGRGQVVLYNGVSELLCQAVCAWTGVPVAERNVPAITSLLTALIDAPAAIGPRYLRGRAARRIADRWAAGHIRRARADSAAEAPAADGPDGGTAVDVIASYRDTDGRLLPPDVAGVELLNVLRPTVAVGRFVVFAALALHENPQWRHRLATEDDPELLEAFVQEVRRFYPFFPMVAARAARDFEWHGHHFPKGRRVLLDLQGTDHDPRLWERPDQFRPERFMGREPDAHSMIPQGGGDHYDGHRCAGEWITKDLMKVSVTALTRWMSYSVPPQDLRVHPWRAPAIPKSRFIVTQVTDTRVEAATGG
ncbi:cytochrome P450 [Actinomadura soli]|uniref:Cytochrome P450 n=1 Tax=Actinomadura soli TaxID=2508997 RepID=A0A5C4JEP1_9ACTN|nr:cytochrome P450 [Actinomadura soli]TMR03447.1 cytochrome P450 [Actinomadura soli]